MEYTILCLFLKPLTTGPIVYACDNHIHFVIEFIHAISLRMKPNLKTCSQSAAAAGRDYFVSCPFRMMNPFISIHQSNGLSRVVQNG